MLKLDIQRFGGRGASSGSTNNKKYQPRTLMFYTNRKRTTLNTQYENIADEVVKDIGGFYTNDLKKYNASEIMDKYKIDEQIEKTLGKNFYSGENFTDEEKKKIKDNIYKIFDFAKKDIK